LRSGGEFTVCFWGVRGSIPVPGPNTVRYGGNTTCLEVRCGEHLIVFDAGTGLRELGRQLAKTSPVDLDLYLTHTHWDHIAGLPFFVPAFNPHSRIRLWAGHLPKGQSLGHVLVNLMMAPLFPVPLDVFRSSCTFNEYVCGETLHPAPGIVVRTGPLNHPNNACGYRVEFGGRVFALITDTEHKGEELDQNVLALARNADVMVYDAMYADDEYAQRYRGWGHSTWQHALRIADAAGVRTTVLFHHDPAHSDEALDRIAQEAERIRPGTLVAREGQTLALT
jgi:phosphoribosyl 1,2-cyclic phosphodiesterase